MKPMKVGDLVALSSYAQNLDSLYRFTDESRRRWHKDFIPLHGIIIKVDGHWGDARYFVKWMKPHAPRGRDGHYGCAFFFRKDLKYVSRS
jgi:hypothetical protein